MKLHIATSREIGNRCRYWALQAGYKLVPMEDCDILVSILYDRILPAHFLAGRRCFNFHPGILPQYRGSGAFSWAILNGETETGVTVHEIDEDIDHGRIIDIVRFPIGEKDTAGSLYFKACDHILAAFSVWLPLLLTGRYEATAQDESLARFYPRKALQNARDITRYARAFHFEGKEQAYYVDADGTKRFLAYADPRKES